MAKVDKVLFMPIYFLPETWNGMDEHMLLLSKHLDRDNYDFIVLAHLNDGAQTRVLAERAGIPLVRAPYSENTSGFMRCWLLADLLRHEKISLLHIHSPAAGGLVWPALAARMAGVKVVVTYHQVQPWQHPLRTQFLNRLTHAHLVDRTIAVSSAVERSLHSNAGIASYVDVILNGIDLDPPEATGISLLPNIDGETRLGYFGRLSPEKGVATILSALALMRALPVRLFIAGEGPQHRELQALAEQLAIADRVEFLGLRHDARQLMAEMDIVVHVPEYEGFGLVLLEAMAAGRALVVNDAPGGMTELVEDGVNGRIVRARSPQALADALRALILDPMERARLGENGRIRSTERYSASSFAARTQTLYDVALVRRSTIRVRRRLSPADVAATGKALE